MGWTKWGDTMEQKYGSPYYHIHRADFHQMLMDLAAPVSKLRLDSTVVSVDTSSSRPSITLSTGEILSADLIIGADGVKSSTRVAMLKELGHTGSARDSGQAAYRIMLNRDQMENDPELLKLIDSDTVTRWIGEKKHIIAYPIHNKQIYNISTAQPDINFAGAPDAQYTTKGSKKAMLEVYGDFCPMVHRMLNLVPEGEVLRTIT